MQKPSGIQRLDMDLPKNVVFTNPLGADKVSPTAQVSPTALSVSPRADPRQIDAHPVEESARASPAVVRALQRLRSSQPGSVAAEITMVDAATEAMARAGIGQRGSQSAQEARSERAEAATRNIVSSIIFGRSADGREVEKAMDAANWDRSVDTVQPTGLWYGLIYPEAAVREFYDMVQLTAVMYTSVVVPIRLAFDEATVPGSAAFWLDVVVDCCFWFDMYHLQTIIIMSRTLD
jgi:hypothetical protein